MYIIYIKPYYILSIDIFACHIVIDEKDEKGEKDEKRKTENIRVNQTKHYKKYYRKKENLKKRALSYTNTNLSAHLRYLYMNLRPETMRDCK